MLIGLGQNKNKGKCRWMGEALGIDRRLHKSDIPVPGKYLGSKYGHALHLLWHPGPFLCCPPELWPMLSLSSLKSKDDANRRGFPF